MTKNLSRSVPIMFLSDLLFLSFSTLFWGHYFKLPYMIIITFMIITVGLIVLFLKGNYKIREFNVTFWNVYRLFEGVIFAHIPAGILLFFVVSKITLVHFLGLNILSVFAALYLYRLCFHYYLFNLKKVKKVLIIGANDRAKAVVEVIRNKKALQMEVVGIVKSAKIDKTLWNELAKFFHYDIPEVEKTEDNKAINEEENFVCENTVIYEDGKDIVGVIKETSPDIVIFAANSFLVPAIESNIKIYKMEEFYEQATGKFFVHEDLMPKFYVEFTQFERSFKGKLYNFSKRIFDIVSALIIFSVTLPITSYIALRVWLIDKESPFFTQTRVGKNGKTFECYKLRTMYANSYVPKNAEMLNDGSDRVIPFCKLIRKAKLDEIPQMLNILKGEMSIVGPRAEWEKFTNVFKNDVPYHNARTLVQAGWTGWAHVSMPAAYSVDEEKERLAYDLYYIKHRNVFWEIGILVKAVFLAVGGRHL